MAELAELAGEANGYLTTTGRRTGQPHEIEIWFVIHDACIYLISGGGAGADWVRNLSADPTARFRIEATSFTCQASSPVPDADERYAVATLLADKYAGHFETVDQSVDGRSTVAQWVDDAYFVRLAIEPEGTS